MGRSSRRRYELLDPELNEGLEALLDQAARGLGSSEDIEFARQMMVTSLRLLRDGAATGDLKLVNSALKELRHAFRVYAPYESRRKVAVFGSARTPPGHPDWEQARAFAARIVAEGWMVITGAGDGIMAAAQAGAGRDNSFGMNIRLPFEQRPNDVIEGDRKLVNFRYFFTRKLMFVKEAHAIVLFPGGFGTLDEGFESLTLIQTGRGEMLPVVFVDAPGGHYWKDWASFVGSHLRERGLISAEDFALFRVADDVDVAVREILNFYSNYHSSRYVDDRLVLRVRLAPSPSQLETLNAEFADIVREGRIESRDPLPQEAGEAPRHARVVLRFNRRDLGRMRALIDRLNSFVVERAAPAEDASPHEIVAGRLPPEAERAEEDDG